MLPRLHESLVRCWRQAELGSSIERITRTQTLESLLLLWRNLDIVVVRHLGASLDDSFDGLLSFRMPTHSPRWIVVNSTQVLRCGRVLQLIAAGATAACCGRVGRPGWCRRRQR